MEEPAPITEPRKPRILVVDDSADTCFLIQLDLEWRGYEVIYAMDGPSALNAAIQERPDVILSDLRMPGMDGYEFATRVRRSPELANVSLIALTALARPSDVERALRAGFNRCVAKTTLEDLPTVVADCLVRS